MKCHICNAPTLEFINEKTSILFYYCEECQYIFKNPNLYQNIELQKERYDLHENSENSESYRAYFQRFLDFIEPYTQTSKVALDFGCGESSLLSKMLMEQGIECDYYDPIYHPKGLDNNKKYNLIVCTEVFEHLHKPKEVFKTLLNKLDKGGYLAIQTEFHPNNIELFKKWYYHQDSTHIVFFTSKTFKVLCNQNDCDFLDNNDKNMVIINKK